MAKKQGTAELSAIIDDIQAKIGLARDADAELERDRKRYAFAAATGEADAKARLAGIGAEKTKLADEVETLQAALSEANARFETAGRAERRAVKVATIRETESLSAAAVEAAVKVDNALKAAADALAAYKQAVERALATGILASPDPTSGFSGDSSVGMHLTGAHSISRALSASGLSKQAYLAEGGDSERLAVIAAKAVELPPHARRFLREDEA